MPTGATMPMREVQLADALNQFIKEQVEAGHYKDASDVMRDALHALELQQRDDDAKMIASRAAISEGDASGVAEGDVFEQAWAAAGLSERSITFAQSRFSRGALQNLAGIDHYTAQRWGKLRPLSILDVLRHAATG